MNTTYFLNLIAGNVFHSDTETAIPTNYYLGLSTTTPTVSGTGVSEPSSNSGYKRLLIDSFTVPSNGTVANTSVLRFPISTDNWGVVTHYVIYDAETGGNLLMYAALKNSKTIEADTLSVFDVEDIALSVANAS